VGGEEKFFKVARSVRGEEVVGIINKVKWVGRGDWYKLQGDEGGGEVVGISCKGMMVGERWLV
jgi:hypothetical protein